MRTTDPCEPYPTKTSKRYIPAEAEPHSRSAELYSEPTSYPAPVLSQGHLQSLNRTHLSFGFLNYTWMTMQVTGEYSAQRSIRGQINVAVELVDNNTQLFFKDTRRGEAVNSSGETHYEIGTIAEQNA